MGTSPYARTDRHSTRAAGSLVSVTTRLAVAVAAVALVAGGLPLAASLLAGGPAAAAPSGALSERAAVTFGAPKWSVPIPDGTSSIALSSPNVAELQSGPAVVVGDQAGYVYAYNLVTGTSEWTYDAGAPVTSTPSVAPTSSGSNLDTVFVGTGNAAEPTVGGYQAISPTGGDLWFTEETNPSTDPTPHSGVRASMAVGDLQGEADVVAGSMGEEEDALTAGSGGVLGGFPWYQADSDFTTPAIADLYGTGANEIIEGGDSSPGASYGTTYSPGGHLRILARSGNLDQSEPNGGLLCQYTTNQVVQSSPAVGEFLNALGQATSVGIVFGTGTYYPTASNTDQLIAVSSSCAFEWSATLDGDTSSSPALADVLGNGRLQVVEGTDTGSTGFVYALDGANGSTLWRTQVGRVIGSVVTADLGGGYQDVLAPTTDGVVVLDGQNGSVITTLDPNVGFQNSPLVTDDPDGEIGITLAGYENGGSVVTHYEIAGSDGALVDETGAWPQFHHDPQLTGNAGTTQSVEVACSPPSSTPAGYYMTGSDGGIFAFGNLPFCGSMGGHPLNEPVVGMAVTANGGGYWEVASDGGIFAFGNAGFYGSMGGTPLVRPVVGMAATPTGGGYWEVASDGGIFAFGSAGFYGSMGGTPLDAPVVGMAATPTGKGYWEVASDGGIFAFGAAKFYGSMGGHPLNKPVVGIAADSATGGYWEVASDGGVFSFGAPFYGSMGGTPLDKPIVGMESSPGGGYRFVAADGGIFSFGAAPFYGSMGGHPLNKPIVAMAGF